MNIILGGTSGLGREITNKLRERGEETLVLGSTYDAARDGQGLSVNLANETSVERAIIGLEQAIGDKALQSFWWVAGVGRNINFDQQVDPNRMATVNFAGALPLVQFAWQKMLAADEGTLAVVSSTSGVTARTDEAVYAATKHAQVGFGRSLGLEAGRIKTRARVALFLPGGMRTEFWDTAQPEARPAVYDTFNDPIKVAQRMIDEVAAQDAVFAEVVIPRGELV